MIKKCSKRGNPLRKILNIFLIFTIFSFVNLLAQENVGIGTLNPDASSILELSSINKGLLIPRLTTTQRDGISSPATGLIIFNTTNNRFEYNSGTPSAPIWVNVLSGTTIPLNNSYIFVGNGSGVATGVAMSGDATISNTGVISIQDNAITGAKINLTGNATGDLMYYNGTDWVVLTPGTAGYVLKSNGFGNAPSWGSAAGTVTSVGLDLPNTEFSISGSPVTTNGTLTASWNTQSQNLIFASPNGSSGIPFFRSLVENDLPNLSATKINGVLTVAQGGTNSSTALNNNRIMVSSGGAIVESNALSNGQLLIGSDGNAPTIANLTSGTGINITNGAGSITINSTVTGITAGTVSNSTVYWDGDSWEENELILSSNAELTLGGTTANIGTLKMWDGTAYFTSILTADLSANRIYTIREVGANADFVLNQGAQNIYGNKSLFGLTKISNHLEIVNSSVANEIRFYEDNANGTNYIGLKSPVSIDNDFIFTLPIDDGTADQVLKTDGSGVLSWTTISGSLPTGTQNQTLFHNGSDWVANSTFLNSGTKLSVNYSGTIRDSVVLHIGDGAGNNDDVLIDGDLIVTGTIDPKALQLTPQSSAPVQVSAEGFIYYDNNSKTLKLTDGSNWKEVGSLLNSNVEIKNSDNSAKELRFYEPSGDGSNYVALKAPTSLTENLQFTLPNTTGGSDTYLKNNGSGGLSWGTVTEQNIVAVTTKTDDYTATISDYVILMYAANKTVTLPTAVGNTGKVFVIKKIGGGGEFTIKANGSETIDGDNTKPCYSNCDFKIITLVSDGSNWHSISSNGW